MKLLNKKLPEYTKGINLVIDTTWGDGGKGKVVDLFSQYADVVVRYAGGPNAGHTIVNKYGECKLHVMPSGIFNPHVLCVISSGVVINPISLVQEITELQKKGIKITSQNFLISQDSHVIMPWHKKRDVLKEVARGGKKIGTTGQGIGPVYADRRAREGFKMKDLLVKDFEKKLLREFNWQSKLTRLMSGELLESEIKSGTKPKSLESPYNYKEIKADLKKAIRILKPFIADSLLALWKAQKNGKNILGEGAQGALLDIDLGGYPYVTSSNPGAVGFIASTGIQGKELNEVYGVTKAYSTRIGEGPLPTELTNKTGKYIQDKGHEFGATTGRPRRCGWFDAVAVRYGSKISGTTTLALTKLDILDDFKTIKICVAYKVKGKKYTYITDPSVMEIAKPIYEEVPGWQTSTVNIKTFADLPKAAKNYISQLEKHTGFPIKLISVAPQRESTILR